MIVDLVAKYKFNNIAGKAQVSIQTTDFVKCCARTTEDRFGLTFTCIIACISFKFYGAVYCAYDSCIINRLLYIYIHIPCLCYWGWETLFAYWLTILNVMCCYLTFRLGSLCWPRGHSFRWPNQWLRLQAGSSRRPLSSWRGHPFLGGSTGHTGFMYTCIYSPQGGTTTE